MSRLRLPSEIARAPSHPGESDKGKFSADQWKTFCTINLPITLVRLWGSSPKDERQYKMLANFMHLVAAVRLANMRSMSKERIAVFDHHLRAYLSELRILYPHTNITPYQHMMLHFGMQLRRFGPVHSWRCFPFERINYILQNIPTNSRFGHMEQTMFIRFCQNQKLRALLKGVNVQHFLPIATLYTDCFENVDNRGTRVADLFDDEIPSEPAVLDWASTSLPLLEKSSYALLQEWINQSDTPGTAFIRAKIVRQAKFRDMNFATQDSGAPNSQVVFNMSGRPWSAGSIQCIFVAGWENEKVQHTKTFVEIYPYCALSNVDAQADNYRQFSFAGRLFYNRLDRTQALVLPLDAIAGHFGHSPQFHSGMQEKTIHVLPLNREFMLDAD
ncbi:hypothetical protein F5879DRAFT_995711 [Lentinula edodes]|nr:hypothetical protein F5879DRAFT_995711 [Lentinula edodes]